MRRRLILPGGPAVFLAALALPCCTSVAGLDSLEFVDRPADGGLKDSAGAGGSAPDGAAGALTGGSAGASGQGGGVAGGGGADASQDVDPSACSATQLDCDGDTSNGCETDATSHPQHCGACGHDCKGGACQSGACQAVLVDSHGGSDVASDATHVYWTHNLGGGGCKEKLYRCAVPGCAAVEAVATGMDIAYGIAVDSDKVFWLGDNAILTWIKGGTCTSCTPPTGDACTVVLDSPGMPWFLAADASHLYWAAWPKGLSRLPKAGGTTQVLDANGSADCQPAVTADRLYYVVGDTIMGCTTASGCADKAAVAKPSSQNEWGEVWEIVAYGGAVYWTDKLNGKILRCAQADCGISAEIVGQAAEGTVALAVDASGLYFADGSGRIYMCPPAGCSGAPKILSDQATGIREGSIALAPDAVYWAGWGTIMRVVK